MKRKIEYFTLCPGKYTLLVRRKGYLPITTEPFELPEGELLTDTVFLSGRQAELSYKDALNESIRRVFGASAMSGMSRLIDVIPWVANS